MQITVSLELPLSKLDKLNKVFFTKSEQWISACDINKVAPPHLNKHLNAIFSLGLKALANRNYTLKLLEPLPLSSCKLMISTLGLSHAEMKGKTLEQCIDLLEHKKQGKLICLAEGDKIVPMLIPNKEG